MLSCRKYGAEIEINSFDFKSRHEYGKAPEGIYYVGNLVRKITKSRVLIHKWEYDHGNSCWIIKPDNSCGMEVCTPVCKGEYSLNKICKVVDAFRDDEKIHADKRCSVHIHVDVSDLDKKTIGAILTWWIKCEAVFMDAMPVSRKRSRYCQFISQSGFFDDCLDCLPADLLIYYLGCNKYYSINTYHLYNRRRDTIEFRIMDFSCCTNSWTLKHWINLVILFVEKAISKGMPADYLLEDKWTSYLWLDPIDVFRFLGFYPNCDPEMEYTRNWFLSRLLAYTGSNLKGIMSEKARSHARSEVEWLKKEILGSSEQILNI